VAVNHDMAALLKLLACPFCRNSLVHDGGRLECTGCGRSFALDRRVPTFIEADAPRPPSQLQRVQYAILGHPRVYEFHQAYGGGRAIAARVKSQVGTLAGVTVLDIGAGTGMVGAVLAPGARYVWLDNDRLKLSGFLRKGLDGLAALGDAGRLPFVSDAVDWTVMVEVSHHLEDRVLQRCLEEAARVTRDRFLFVDAVRGTRLRSRLLWQLDLGRYPRTEDELTIALDRNFEVEKVERFRVNHDHLLCVCVPRRAPHVSSGG
jgi:SAM-dependent methyltransferase